MRAAWRGSSASTPRRCPPVSRQGGSVRAQGGAAGPTPSTRTRRRTSTTARSWSRRSASRSSRVTRCSTSPAATAGSARFLLARGLALPRRRRRAGDGRGRAAAARRPAAVELGDLNDYAPAGAGRRDDGLPRDLLRRRPRRVLRAGSPAFTERKLVFDLNPRQYRVADVRRPSCDAAGFARVELRPFFVPQTRRLPRPVGRRSRRRPSAPGRSPGSRCACASRTSSPRPVAARRDARRTRRALRARAARRSLVCGSTLAGTNVSISTSTRHGPSGVGSATVRTAQAGHVDRLGRGLARRSPAACRRPRPSSPIRTRATPGQAHALRAERLARERHDGGARRRPRRRRTGCSAARAGTEGSPGSPTPSRRPRSPVWFERSLIGPSSRTRVASGVRRSTTCSPTTSTPFAREHVVGLGVGRERPVDVLEVGRQRVARARDRCRRRSRPSRSSGSRTRSTARRADRRSSAARAARRCLLAPRRSTQSFGFGMFASTRALKSCSPIDGVDLRREVPHEQPRRHGDRGRRRERRRPATERCADQRGAARRRGAPATTSAFSIRSSGQAHSRFASARIARPCAS